ncbi:MAG: PAS domain-containing protein [Actinobacteria bacterium]|nr:PAS domain-containing protein [Actinomycetota bacterium]
MDTTLLVLGAAAAAVALVAIVAIVHARRLAKSVDLALARIGGEPSHHWWQRPRVLDREVRILEEGVEESAKDRARLAAAVAEASIGILLTDDDGVVLHANETASSFLGARHGEAVAEARMRQAIEAAILSRTSQHKELEIYTPQRRFLDIRAIPLEHGVESLGAVAYITDVTEPHRVAAMRSDFIANVSHELKTPLGALAVLAETLAANRGDPEVTTRMADRLVQESRRLSKLIGDILDLSQAEAADRSRTPVDLGTLLSAVAAGFGEAAADRGLDLTVAAVPPSAVVLGETRQLATLFTNLVENALTYTPAGTGDRRPRIGLSAAVAGQEIIVVVEDEGIGISEQHLGRIFERFYRVDKGRSRETGGTGLGLSIARHIARNHGGDITVESQVGVGTTFRVRLPMWRAP